MEHQRLLYLETNNDQILDRTVKHDEILRGPFGTVYANKTCFYSRPVASGYSSVSVGAYSNQLEHEVPIQLTGLPGDLPPLSSVSLVRIFRTDPEYLVVSANYEPNGKLGSLHIDKTKDGDWVSGGNSLHPDLQDPRLERYGIPARIDVQEYIRLRRLPIPTVRLPHELTVLNRHYGYDKIIRQDTLRDAAVASSRFLRPSVTKEEQILDSVCESRFREQQSMEPPTVE